MVNCETAKKQKEEKLKKLFFAMIASVAAVGAAQAQTAALDTAPRSYIGAGVASTDRIGPAGSKTDAKIFGGVEFNNNLGVEAGHIRFSSQDFSRSAGTRSVTGTIKGSSTYVAGKYTLPINEQFSAYGKLGVAYSERKNDYVETNSGVSRAEAFHDYDTGAYGGLGVQYKLNENVALTAEYERFGKKKMTGATAESWTVGAKYAF